MKTLNLLAFDLTQSKKILVGQTGYIGSDSGCDIVEIENRYYGYKNTFELKWVVIPKATTDP